MIEAKHHRLVTLMEAFVSSVDTSTEQVREIEGAFAETLDDEDAFVDLQHELAMCDGSRVAIERLKKECAVALRQMRKTE